MSSKATTSGANVAPGNSISSSSNSAAKKKAGSAAAAAAAASKNAGTSVSMSAKKPDGAAAATSSLGDHTASSGDLFARSVSMMAVAHVARGAGFDAVQRSAGDALVEILAKYIQQVGNASKDIAELAGRTQPRATDVMQALRDMLPMPVELPDLIKALETAKRPFPRDVPSFPARKRDSVTNALDASAIGSRDALPPHVPSFLPPLPSRHTYSAKRRVVVDRDDDTKRLRLDLLDQKSQLQQSLHSLQRVFTATQPPTAAAAMTTWSATTTNGESSSSSTSDNPFKQPPVVVGATAADAKSVFRPPERVFAPLTHRTTTKSASMLENSALALPKMQTTQELGKEEKILTGTFHDGDSE